MNLRTQILVLTCAILLGVGTLYGCSKLYRVTVYNSTSDICRIRMAGEDVVVPGKTIGKFVYNGFADPKYRIKCGNGPFFGGDLNDCVDCRSGTDWIIQLTAKGVESVEYLDAFK